MAGLLPAQIEKLRLSIQGLEAQRAALETNSKVILDVADKLTIPEWRQAFLEAVPDNRALLEMWERSKG